MRTNHDDIVFEQDECESACSFATCLSSFEASPGRRGSDHGAKVRPAICSPDLAVPGTAAAEVSEDHERSGSSSERSASSTMSEASFGKVAHSDKPARHRERAAGASTDHRVPSFEHAPPGQAGEDRELAEVSEAPAATTLYLRRSAGPCCGSDEGGTGSGSTWTRSWMPAAKVSSS